MIDAVVTKFGLARMPFGRDLPPSRLHRHRDCGEAAARIAWAVADKTICMVTGEVGTGKTVAIRAAVADLDPASHTVIYVGNPSTGVRGILAHVVTALGGKPVHGTAALAVQAWNVLAGEAAERGRTPVLVIVVYRPQVVLPVMSVWDRDQHVPGLFTDRVRDVCHVLESVRRTSGTARGGRGPEGPADRAEGRAAVVDDRVARGDGAHGGGPVPASA